MRKLAAVLATLAVALLLTSCPMPSLAPEQADPETTDPEPLVPVVVTDTARNVAVFVSEDGTRTDVVAEEPDGSLATCTEAFTLSLFDPEPGPNPGSVPIALETPPGPPRASAPSSRGVGATARLASGSSFSTGPWCLR